MIQIDPDSPVPKYRQIVASVEQAIKKGELQRDQQLPSINEMAEEHYLARDTVEKAYNELKERGIIMSVRGKGYFVQAPVSNKLRVLLVMNKLSAYKKIIYYAFLKTLGNNVTVDVVIHHYNALLFKEIWEAHRGKYSFYVVMPHFYEGTDKVDVRQLLEEVPKNELVLLDRDLPDLTGEYLAIYQDFEKDIFRALESADDLLAKYHELVLVFPSDGQYPAEIVRGFRNYCINFQKEFRILENAYEENISSGTAYVVVEETDLAELLKKVRQSGLELGQQVGIASFNDTTLKEVLADGITVLTTDFETMGRTAAALLLDGKRIKVKNPFMLIRRKSL
ncbi:GntR family transcriptional regulator [Telluribacter sp.]|jgi:DNA-binding transcriptional regulator YhcF (GntR family)|uniref:GntR family transcriptional regulator n=1 Tax=Telluribacter sp. TaxID=1978767 RepID=UPI002E10C18A|nr:GntR family transcriptional regulator [Telluribacter sp.]